MYASMPPSKRQPTIFGMFNKLIPGETMPLVNDHDPKAVLHQFQVEFEDLFTWDCIEKGPELWRVCIGRVAACCA
jgi:uncharacterized protein (DUF2249 family)